MESHPSVALPGDQNATVKLEAFPFTRYGMVPAEVIGVSRDANKDDKLDLVYPVRLQPAMPEIEVDARRVPIAPGMAVSAEIITGELSIARKNDRLSPPACHEVREIFLGPRWSFGWKSQAPRPRSCPRNIMLAFLGEMKSANGFGIDKWCRPSKPKG